MDSSHSSRRAREIFESALDRDSKADQDTYIRKECGEDGILLRQVRALVEAHEAGESFLPAQPAGGRNLAGETERPGERIGQYRLLEKLGEGGCGVIYMAEQEVPVRRKVALKIIKLGMDTRSVIARFEAERQALALMDHPNIAKVLEAGATDTGRPYFVMELVGGIKITDYCEQNHLDTRQRLDLFIQVCRAVQHAHQKGIIHRDIKPSNVLVAEQDGVAVPKVIDFGIAKATQGKLTDDTVFTAFEQFLGTPAYMSPEQAQLGGLDVDTRSDIYSLGVLLYELLTGKTPFDAKELLAAGLDAMRRTICEKEPPTPSTRLKQETAARATSSDHSALRTLHSALDRDLDWIVMKCLEKNRARRYETANGLARDIERHLHNEPVVASPPGALYRLGKFARRNKAAVIAAAATTAVLVIGTVASVWDSRQQSRLRRQAQTDRARAQTEAVKSQQVAKFLKQMLEGVGPSKALGRDTTMLKEILDKTAERVGKELTNQPEVEIELRDSLATTYQELGLYKQMEEMQRENLRLARQYIGADSLAAARALRNIAGAEWFLARYEPAGIAAREALALYRKLLGQEHRDVAESIDMLALVLRAQGKAVEAEAMFREALAMLRKLMGNKDPAVAMELANLAQALLDQSGTPGKLAEAEALLREALSIRREAYGAEHPDIAVALQTLGEVLLRQSKAAEAEAVCREALGMQRKLLANGHPDLANAILTLAAALYNQDKLADAEALDREALDMQRKLLGNKHTDVAYALNDLANVLSRQGKLAEAEETYREGLAIQRELLGPDHPHVATSLYNLAKTVLAEGRPHEAEEMLREVLVAFRKNFGEENPQVAMVLNTLATALQNQGRLAEAEPMARDALVTRRKLLGEEHAAVVSSLDNLVSILQKESKLAEAETLSRDQLGRIRAQVPANDPRLASTLAVLVRTLLLESKFSEAESPARECLAMLGEKSPDDWRAYHAQRMLGASLLGQNRYAEAEPLLLLAYEGMKQREAKIPAVSKVSLKDALQALVQLYELQGRSDQAADWKHRLEDFDLQTNSPELPSSTRPHP
jgi:serine/threonine protein kinase